MVSDRILALEPLLAPIPGGSPVGVDLRGADSPLYHDLRFLRTEARAEERLADAGTPDRPDKRKWEELARGCERALREQTKDFEVACWLIESLTRARRGDASEFAGLREGFQLLDGLCARYGKALFSVADDSDHDAWLAPIMSLEGGTTEGALVAAIRKIPLTPRRPPGPFSYGEIMQRDKFDMVEVYESVRGADAEFFPALAADIEGALAAADALDDTVYRCAGAESAYGRIYRIRDLLSETRRMVMQLSALRHRLT